MRSQTAAEAWPQLVEGSAHECSTQYSLSQRTTSACLARSLACLAPNSTMPLPVGVSRLKISILHALVKRDTSPRYERH